MLEVITPRCRINAEFADSGAWEKGGQCGLLITF